MAEKKNVQDYAMLCRTCLKSNVEMLNLSALINDNLMQNESKISYMDCLRTCIQLVDIEEEMPGRICLECASALQVAYWFMKNASQAQELLKQKLREIRCKKQKTEIMASVEELKKTKKFRCKICNEKVETKRSLKEHVKLHLDMIVYNCQLCSFESHTRNYLSEHYMQMHGVDASKEQLKPRTKLTNTSSTGINKTDDHMMGAIKNEHFQVLPELTQQSFANSFQSSFASTFKTETIAATNLYYSNPTDDFSVLASNHQQNYTTISNPFTALDANYNAVTNDLSIGNEFIVMADGSVEEVMGKDVVIEYINAGNDNDLTLDNGNLVVDNLMQIPDSNNTNMLVTQNDIMQMDVDDLIIEDPVNTPEETQELSHIVEENMSAAVVEPPKTLICKICTKDFIAQEQLKNHMLNHREIPHFFCDQCKFYTFFKIDLHQHYKSKHNLHPTSKQLQPKNQQEITKHFFACDLCYYEFELKSDLRRHYINVHKIDAGETHLGQKLVDIPVVDKPAVTAQTKRKEIISKVIAKNVKIKTIEQESPDYPNGLSCRKCHQVFYWRNELYEHYKLHNAEEAALKQEKQMIKIQNKQQASQSQKVKTQKLQTEQQFKTQTFIRQTSIEQPNTSTFSNLDSLPTTNNTTYNTMAPLTPSSSSTYTLPLDAIPQIVETDQTIENNMDFDFNGDALFEDFDDDVDVENDSDDNDHEFRNVLLTSDDDFEEMMQEQNNPHNADELTESYCSHCQKNFSSQYQFENHMFVHRGLAPYRCEMCTNLYNTKRCLIRHYKAVHKKVPSRDMIQAKGDKVCEDKTPVQHLNVEEATSLTLMCAKCPYESTILTDLQSHLFTSHSLNDESYILKKLPFECSRCIRSFATKTKLLRHLERNHSLIPINEHQVRFDSIIKTTATTGTSSSTTINNHMMNNKANEEEEEANASCVSGDYDQYLKQQQQLYGNLPSTSRRVKTELSIEDAVAPNIIMSNFQDDDITNSSTPMTFDKTSRTQQTSSTNDNSNKPSDTINNNALKSSTITVKENIVKEEDEEEEEEEEEEYLQIGEEEEQALFKCKVCHLTCYNLESFNQHSKQVDCKKIGPSLPENTILFECQICRCNYKSMYLLKHHLKRHIGRKFRCTQCPKTFINKVELECHNRVHSGERPHKCDTCSTSFRYVHHLKRHIDIVHLGKRHECTEPNCSRKFTTLAQLKIHIWSHNGIVPYKCVFCDRLFKKRQLLREHCMKLHKINLSEEEMAEIFRNSLGYTNPHDFTVAITNGKMLRRADLETMGASGVIKSSFK